MVNSHAPVYINFRQTAPFAWTEEAWTSTIVKIPLVLDIQALRSYLGALVKRRLHADAKLSRKLKVGDLRLVLHSTISIPGCAWGPLNLDQDIRIELVRDLFLDPDYDVEDVKITVWVQLETKTKTSRDGEDVCIPERPKQPEFYRIGYVSLDVDEYPEPMAKRKHGKHGPSYTWALITYRDEKTKKWKFRKVHAYDFDDYCIGDVNERTSWNSFEWGTEAIFLGPYEYVYEHPNSKGKMVSLLERMIKDGDAEIAPGVPILPTYSFNKYDPSEYGMGLTVFPKSGIDVVVKCVNHLGRHNASLSNIMFPRDLYFVAHESDGPAQVEQHICDSIRYADLDDGYEIDCKMLFSMFYRGTWRMELWAMPQLEEEFTLFRYVEGSLGRFLDGSERVRKREKRIYVEAHFVAAV